MNTTETPPDNPGNQGQNKEVASHQESTLEEKRRALDTANKPKGQESPSKDHLKLEGIEGYEPLMRHRSRLEKSLREQGDAEAIDRTKMDFYVSYFLKKLQRRLAIGLKTPTKKDLDNIIRSYVTDGFTKLPATERNDHRTTSNATQTLAKATAAWQQHLRRSGLSKEKQIAVFIPEVLYGWIKKAHYMRQRGLPPGHTIAQNQVIVELLEKGLKKGLYIPTPKQDSSDQIEHPTP